MQSAEVGPVELPLTEQEEPPACRPQTFDLLSLVISYKRMEIYLEPLCDSADVVRYLLRWQSPASSLLCCFTLNFLFLTLTEAAWFVLCGMVICIPAFLGYLQDCWRERLPEQDLLRRRYHSVQREDLQKVQLSRQEALAEVKVLLIHLDERFSRFCSTCEFVYRVLFWEDHSQSSLFYGALLGALCVFYLLPFCWFLTILNTTIFFGSPEFSRVLMEYKASILERFNPKPEETVPENLESEGGAMLDRTPTPTSMEDLSPASVEDVEEAEPEEEFKDAIEEEDDVSAGALDYDLGLQDNGFLSKNEPIRSKVSKLTEKLRKRYPTNNYDDIIIFASSPEELQTRIQELNKASRRVGLKINLTKTKVMFNRFANSPTYRGQQFKTG
ncbi:protrudin isoform X2 [Latimeria chalumnae]|uniref:protrudin isoform X2 n=1 Tax=Latimeria chalumnae TaxID=7897 RepID=UPI00313AAFD7